MPLKTGSITIGTGTPTSLNQHVTSQATLPENIIRIVKMRPSEANSVVWHLG